MNIWFIPHMTLLNNLERTIFSKNHVLSIEYLCIYEEIIKIISCLKNKIIFKWNVDMNMKLSKYFQESNSGRSFHNPK